MLLTSQSSNESRAINLRNDLFELKCRLIKHFYVHYPFEKGRLHFDAAVKKFTTWWIQKLGAIPPKKMINIYSVATIRTEIKKYFIYFCVRDFFLLYIPAWKFSWQVKNTPKE